MKYPSPSLHNGYSPKIETSEALALLEQGLNLCKQWESLAEQQFSALQEEDLQALSVIQASQLRLARQFYKLVSHWRQAFRTLVIGASEPPIETGVAPTKWGAILRAKRFQFAVTVQRVFAMNDRNAKALGLLILLGATCEPLTSNYQPTYDRNGSLVSRSHSLVTTIDREG